MHLIYCLLNGLVVWTNRNFYLFLSFETLQLSTAGGRLIISSDGVWDALSAEEALSCCRGLPADVAAAQIVKVIL